MSQVVIGEYKVGLELEKKGGENRLMSSVLVSLPHTSINCCKAMFDDNFHICMIYGIEIKSINQSIFKIFVGS
jgi:hypothetical protein